MNDHDAAAGFVPRAISVVVCTRDRPALLARCLEGLARQGWPAFEVVVVDNASRTSETRAVVETAGHRYVFEPRPGLDFARNRGWQEARHELIAYVDDDAIPEPGWLSALVAAFADRQVAAVTGRVVAAELRTEAQRRFEQYGGMDKGIHPRIFQRDGLTPEALLAVHACGVGANMAVRRAVLAALGGFDPRLDVGTPAGGAGDLDLFHRLLVAGHMLRYEPLAVVAHRHRETMAALERQIYLNGRSYAVYLLTILRAGRLPRRQVLGYGRRWVSQWVIGRLRDRAAGRLDYPWRLVVAELRGMLSGPWAYCLTNLRSPTTSRAFRRASFAADRP